jgi:NAD(P)-dependent dehydrogenase (short-subunit alcohol dehydrogenase family)
MRAGKTAIVLWPGRRNRENRHAARAEANSRASESARDQRRGSDEGRSARVAADQAIRRSLAEIAGLATFLCSDEAASITGALLPIDGGWTAANHFMRIPRTCRVHEVAVTLSLSG